MRIPRKFEYADPKLSNPDNPYPVFVTVLRKYRHHYTNELMYYVRLEHMTRVMKVGVTEYGTLSHDELLKKFALRIK